jgi:DNA-binding IclR family transcriptional regulator
VRREVVNRDGEVFITMAVPCHSSRFDCDQLIEQFEQINQNLKRKLADDSGS